MRGAFEPFQGVRVWRNKKGTVIFRLHFSADPAKDWAWAERQKKEMSDPAMYQQELEIDFGATGGTLLFNYDPEASEEDEFIVPPEWTRFTGLDPHPVKPHAMLWAAADPYGLVHIYREYWPSRICGMSGVVPEVDNRVSIGDYVACVKFLESDENAQNGGAAENIYRRQIDYAARAFGKGTSDDPEAGSNFQERFEIAAEAIDLDFQFVDAKKDHSVGYEIANSWLKPIEMEDPKTGEVRKMSRVQIMRQRCPELIWQLRHNRRRKSTAAQAENDDPMMRIIRKRNDVSDCFRYILAGGVEYVDPNVEVESTWKPSSEGMSY